MIFWGKLGIKCCKHVMGFAKCLAFGGEEKLKSDLPLEQREELQYRFSFLPYAPVRFFIFLIVCISCYLREKKYTIGCKNILFLIVDISTSNILDRLGSAVASRVGAKLLEDQLHLRVQCMPGPAISPAFARKALIYELPHHSNQRMTMIVYTINDFDLSI